MIPNHYERERMAQTHRQELLREAEHERLAAQVSLYTHKTPLFATRLILSLRALRTRLQYRFQRRSA